MMSARKKLVYYILPYHSWGQRICNRTSTFWRKVFINFCATIKEILTGNRRLWGVWWCVERLAPTALINETKTITPSLAYDTSLESTVKNNDNDKGVINVAILGVKKLPVKNLYYFIILEFQIKVNT